MDTTDILEALREIARTKSVDPAHLFETVRLGLITAAKRRYATAADVEVFFDEANGRIRVLVHKKVVPVAIDLGGEIDLEEARQIRSNARLGDIVPVDVPVAEFGRNAIQAAKQVLVQRVREAERGNVVAEYAGRKGTILSGVVSQVDRGSVIVKIGKTEGIIPPRELMFRDRFKIGDTVRALLKTVDENQKGPMLILSRTDPEFVRRLFENEVPEIFERVVEIRDIAREPGSRTKLTVVSHDDRVDPVGACVGMKGSRVQSIVRELVNERIDIVPWSSDPKVLISRALQPAKVLDVILREGEEKRAEVIVPDDDLVRALGQRQGQNVRLAQKLTGWIIEVKTLSQQGVERGGGVLPDLDLEDLTEELGVRTVEKLIRAGKETLQDILRTPAEELMQIPGIAEKTASRLLAQARQILEGRAAGGAAGGTAGTGEALATQGDSLGSGVEVASGDSAGSDGSDEAASGAPAAPSADERADALAGDTAEGTPDATAEAGAAAQDEPALDSEPREGGA